jgi:hypothetical protein
MVAGHAGLRFPSTKASPEPREPHRWLCCAEGSRHQPPPAAGPDRPQSPAASMSALLQPRGGGWHRVPRTFRRPRVPHQPTSQSSRRRKACSCQPYPTAPCACFAGQSQCAALASPVPPPALIGPPKTARLQPARHQRLAVRGRSGSREAENEGTEREPQLSSCRPFLPPKPLQSTFLRLESGRTPASRWPLPTRTRSKPRQRPGIRPRRSLVGRSLAAPTTIRINISMEHRNRNRNFRAVLRTILLNGLSNMLRPVTRMG